MGAYVFTPKGEHPMTTTKESKIDATDRLRREGRWEEAQRYRDEVRKKLRADGMKRTEAGEAAWDAMLDKYRPLADAPEPGSAVLPGGDLPAEWANADAPDLIGDFLWVYSQLGNPQIQTACQEWEAIISLPTAIGAAQLPRWSRRDDHYTKDSDRRAIVRACDRAEVAPWSPNRLRHSRATELRHRFGLEAAQTVLGHASADVTQVYAERDFKLAMQIMQQVG